MHDFGMRALAVIFAMTFWTGLSLAQETAASDEPPAADAAREDPEAKEELEPPPGFRTKKQGGIVVYCIKDSTVGTRFRTEKCYDREQMKDYLLARDENKRDMDQRRSICTSCASN